MVYDQLAKYKDQSCTMKDGCNYDFNLSHLPMSVKCGPSITNSQKFMSLKWMQFRIFRLTRRFHDEKTILSIHRLRSPNERNFGYFSTSTFSRAKKFGKIFTEQYQSKIVKKKTAEPRTEPKFRSLPKQNPT